MESPDLPRVSIVVPVFEHAEQLEACLTGIARQRYPSGHIETVVVDNGCETELSRRFAAFAGVRVVAWPTPGSYAARNHGIQSTTGEIIALTDADCVPDPDWIAKGVESLRARPGCGLVAGRIDIECPDTARATAVELYETTVGWRQREYVERWRFGATANLFTFRRIFESVGLFDATLMSLGDREWGRRVHNAGYTLVYASEARVRQAPRRTLSELRRRSVRVTGGFYSIATRKGWPAGALLQDAGLGLPFGPLRPGRDDGRPVPNGLRQLVAVHAVGAFVMSVRVLELARLLLGGRASRA